MRTRDLSLWGRGRTAARRGWSSMSLRAPSPAVPHRLLPCPLLRCRSGCLACPWLAGSPAEDLARGRRSPALDSSGLAAGIPPPVCRPGTHSGALLLTQEPFHLCHNFLLPFLFAHWNMSLPAGGKERGLAMHIVLIFRNKWSEGPGLFYSVQFHLYCSLSRENFRRER